MPTMLIMIFEQVKKLEQLIQELSDQPNQEKEELLNIKQVADLLGLAVPTIYSLVSRGQIPVSKRSGKLFFLKTEIFDWIKAGRRRSKVELQKEAEKFFNSQNPEGRHGF